MISFSIGMWSLAGMAAMPLVYFAGVGTRRFVAYMDGTAPPPKKPHKAWVALALVFGFALGSVYQGTSQDVSACRATGQTLGACLLVPEAARD